MNASTKSKTVSSPPPPHVPDTGEQKNRGRLILTRALLCLVVLAVGFGGMNALIRKKKAPPKSAPQPPTLRVSLQEVSLTNVVTQLEGYGVVKALRYTELSPEVSGRVIALPSDLRIGDRVKMDQLLFKIDSRDYASALAEGKAQLTQFKASLERLTTQEKSNRNRKKILASTHRLALKEFQRQQSLFQDDNIGSEANVERAEQAANQTEDQLLLLDQALSLVPAQRAELTAQLDAAQARMKRAALNLERCEVRAPFEGRVTFAALERGQQLMAGQPVLTLADDRMLEIQAPIDSADLRKWLRLKPGSPGAAARGLPPVEPVDVAIRWTESTETLSWRGRLHRLVDFDATTRTATVAIRISEENAKGIFPLIDGMFCEVLIPGKTLKDVILVPASAITYNQKAYLSVSNRLKTVDVTVLRTQGEEVVIRRGLRPGDQLITTRLVAPLEGIALTPVVE